MQTKLIRNISMNRKEGIYKMKKFSYVPINNNGIYVYVPQLNPNGYNVRTFKNGTVVLKPKRKKEESFEISEKAFEWLDHSAQNLQKGISGIPIDLD